MIFPDEMDVVWYCFLLFLLLWQGFSCRLNSDYLERETTDAVKGFFIGTVFFRHFANYTETGFWWRPLDAWMDQLIVAMFLFYSGFGVMAQYEKRGSAYLRSIPKKRVIPLLVNFDVAVVLFAILGFLLGRTYTIRQFALSLLAWKSVGNSNWYIFTVLICYMATFLSFVFVPRRCNGHHLVGIANLGLFLLLYSLFLRRIKPYCWYDTVFCFWGGAAYGLFRKNAEAFLDERWMTCLATGIVVAVVLPVFPKSGRWLWAFHNARALSFVLAVIAASRRFRISSALMAWCGKHIFPLYIYQRIPMLLFRHVDPHSFSNGDSIRLICYFCASLTVTMLLASAFKYFRYPWKCFPVLRRYAT